MWHVGTSGWQYRDWRGTFYPERLAQKAWLEHYVTRFETVEVNNTFYRLPDRRVFAGWAERTPAEFVMTLKLSRYLSHIRRLRDPDDSMRLFLDRIEPLRRAGRVGPLLLQLPPTMPAEIDRLAAVVAAVPDDLRLAVEFRHESWFTDEVFDLLGRNDVALCLADRHSQALGPVRRTASWGYLRMHEGRARPWPCYGEDALAGWVDRIGRLWPEPADVYVYFNNDPGACAPRNAERFADLASRSGFDVARPTQSGGRVEHEVSRRRG
jgi:uncharacterized protein YecE (DUF72 family)